MLKLSKKSMVTGDFFSEMNKRYLYTNPNMKILNSSFHKESKKISMNQNFFLFQKLCFINFKGNIHYLRLIYVPFSEKLPAQL